MFTIDCAPEGHTMAATLDDEIKEHPNNRLNIYPLLNAKLGKFSAEKSF